VVGVIALKTTKWTYDAGDRVVSRGVAPVPSGNQQTTFSYNAYGWLTGVDDSVAQVSYDYDVSGRLRRSVDGVGFERWIAYDGRGRADRVLTADRGWVEMGYTVGASLGSQSGPYGPAKSRIVAALQSAT
jgi:hypothetical protein